MTMVSGAGVVVTSGGGGIGRAAGLLTMLGAAPCDRGDGVTEETDRGDGVTEERA